MDFFLVKITNKTKETEPDNDVNEEDGPKFDVTGGACGRGGG